jgi:hypothetical protein
MGHRGDIVVGKRHCFAFGVAKLATSHFGWHVILSYVFISYALFIYLYIYIIDGFLSQAILDYVHGGS